MDSIAESILFPPAEIDKVAKGLPPARLKQAIDRARVILWASSGEKPPADLVKAVEAARQGEASVVLLPFEFRPVPLGNVGEMAFKAALREQSRAIAGILRLLEESLEALREAAPDRADAPLRWQAHYDYVMARTTMQLAFLYELSTALGQMRMELPPYDPKLHRGWVPASQPRMSGDLAGRRLAREARKQLESIIVGYRGTPWELLARRDRVTNLGLEWRPRH